MSVYIQTGFNGLTEDLNHPRIAFNRRREGTGTGSTEAAGFDAVNAGTVRLDTAWRPTAVPATWTNIFLNPRNVQYVGIAGHDLGTQNASIAIQTTVDGGSTWDTVAGLGAITPEDDSAILCLFDTVNADGYRVAINSADDNPTIATIAGGAVQEWPRKAVWTGTPITEGDKISFSNNTSETGVLTGRTRVSDGLEFQVTVNNLSEAFRTGDFKEFKAYANGEDAAFFIAHRPLDYQDEVAYAWATETVRMTRETPNHRVSGSVTLNLMGHRQDL